MTGNNPINVLLIEKDDAVDSIRTVLQQIVDVDFNLKRADEAEAATQMLTDERADLIVVDLAEENGRALDLLEKVRTEAKGLPCIVLTGSKKDIARLSSTITTGAVDFLVKDEMTAEEMSRSIKYVANLSRLKVLEETVKNQEQINRLIQAVTSAVNTTDELRPMLQNCAQAIVDELDGNAGAFTKVSASHPDSSPFGLSFKSRSTACDRADKCGGGRC